MIFPSLDEEWESRKESKKIESLYFMESLLDDVSHVV